VFPTGAGGPVWSSSRGFLDCFPEEFHTGVPMRGFLEGFPGEISYRVSERDFKDTCDLSVQRQCNLPLKKINVSGNDLHCINYKQ